MATSPKAADAWQYLLLASPLLGLAANVLVQLVSFRVRKGAQFFCSIIEGVSSGAVVLCAFDVVFLRIQSMLIGGLLLSLAVNALIYLALSYCYYHFVQLGQTSIRIRIYREIAECGKGLTVQELARRYGDGALLQLRLQRLLESGDVVQRNGRYFVGRSRLVRVANALFVARRFLLGGRSEFEAILSRKVSGPETATQKDEGPQS